MSQEQTLEDAATRYAFVMDKWGSGELPESAAFDVERGQLAVVLQLPSVERRVDVLELGAAGLERVATLQEPRSMPRALGFLPDGRLLYAEHGDHVVIKALDGTSRQQIAASHASAACVRPDGSALFYGSVLMMWQGKKTLRKFEDKRAYYGKSVDMSPDGRFAASTAKEPYVRLWDVASGKQLKRVKIGQSGAPYMFQHYAQFAPDGSVLACGGEGEGTQTKRVWLLNVDKTWSERAKLTLPSTHYVYGLGFSADGERLWVSQHELGRSEGVISVWDWRAGVCLHTITIRSAMWMRTYAVHVAMDAQGKRVIATLSQPPMVAVFETP